MHLTRIVPDANLHRFYQLEIVPGLFDNWGLVRNWGRIGSFNNRRLLEPIGSIPPAEAEPRSYACCDPRLSSS